MKILPAVDQSSNASTASGVLVFQRPQEHALTPETPILEIFVAGDTATNLYTQLHGHSSSRPMVHDLMATILSRMAEVNQGKWQLVKAAVVGLDQEIFIGRLFFGDPATGTIVWDCDCRPSDGVYLSLRAGCPFYVHREVWEQASVAIRHSKVHMIACAEHMAAAQQQQGQQQTAQQQGQHGQGQQQQTEGSSSAAGMARSGGGHHGNGQHQKLGEDYMTLRPDDHDAIKLLKRELAVAVREEDYASAVRLRDHPYMQMNRRIEAFEHVGSQQEADTLRRELATMIERCNYP